MLGYGFKDGLSGAIIKPYEGATEGGWAGFGKGPGKEAMGLDTGLGAGMSSSKITCQMPILATSMACSIQLRIEYI